MEVAGPPIRRPALLVRAAAHYASALPERKRLRTEEVLRAEEATHEEARLSRAGDYDVQAHVAALGELTLALRRLSHKKE